MNTDQTTISESELRAMRDIVYGQPSTDKNWNACKEKWQADAEWLQERAQHIGAKHNP